MARSKNVEPVVKSSEVESKKPKVVMLEEYFNFRNFKKDFMTNLMMDRLAQELLDWALNNDEAIKIKQFLVLKGISEKNWFDWYSKYEVLKNAHEHAKTIIGNRREFGVMTRKYETTTTAFMMPMYDKDWETQQQRKADLAKKDDGGSSQVVVIERYPDSPLVPVKKERDE